VYYTASPQLANDIQSLCLVAGRVSEVWGPYGSMFQVYIGEPRSVVPFVLRGGRYPDIAIEQVHDRRIVCFTVPNEVLITRRRGRVAIQGNTKHATHLVRLMRTCRDLVVDGVIHVYRPDREELLAIRRGEWRYEQLVEDVPNHGPAADAAIREGRSPLPAAPDEAAISAACIELTNAGATR